MVTATNICIAHPWALIFMSLIRARTAKEGCVEVRFKGLLSLMWLNFPKGPEYFGEVPTEGVT